MAIYEVKKSFQGREDVGHLCLSPGDIVTVDNDTKIQLWVWASVSNGKEGYVPLDCIDKLPESKTDDPEWTSFCCDSADLILEQIYSAFKRNTRATTTSSTQDKRIPEKSPCRNHDRSSNIDSSSIQVKRKKLSAARQKDPKVMKTCVETDTAFNDIPMKPNLIPKTSGTKRHHHNPFDDESKAGTSEFDFIEKKQYSFNPFDDESIPSNPATKQRYETTLSQKDSTNPFDAPILSNEVELAPTLFSGEEVSEKYHNPFD